MRIFLMTPVGVVVTTRGRERVKDNSFVPWRGCTVPVRNLTRL